jgi:antitoxin component YwqK of YwqJK toxin-antitoxin module
MKKYLKITFILSMAHFACQSSSQPQEEKRQSSRTVEDYVEHYPSGIKKIEGKMLNGERHGDWVYYYEDGIKWSEGRYKNGKRVGYSRIYYENGKLKLQGKYEDDVRVGIWKVWNNDGTFADSVDMDKKLAEQKLEDKLNDSSLLKQEKTNP